jgi:hypothetical protein
MLAKSTNSGAEVFRGDFAMARPMPAAGTEAEKGVSDSTMLAHAPHSVQRPCHPVNCASHFLQIYIVEVFAIDNHSIISKSPLLVYVFIVSPPF